MAERCEYQIRFLWIIHWNALCFPFFWEFLLWEFACFQNEMLKYALKLYTHQAAIYLLAFAGQLYKPPKDSWMPGSGVDWRNGMVRPRHVMRLAIEHAYAAYPLPLEHSREILLNNHKTSA